MARTRAFGVLLAALLLLTAQAASQSLLDVSPAWGEAHDGLRIGIARAPQTSSSVAFTLVLHNSGTRDVVIDLGEMLSGPGPRMSPSALRLALTDSDGSTRELQWVEWCTGTGRDFMLVLPVGAFYQWPVSLFDEQWGLIGGGRLPAGRYRIHARLQGAGAVVDPVVIERDVPGRAPIRIEMINPLNLWTGTVRSGDVEFDLSQALPVSVFSRAIC